MVGASKILTVSYGTFSCTLEGFDDPFSTMKAIAEYFRDLAANDRFFGAEPPTPDVQMLHSIAQQNSDSPVDAKVEEGGLRLTQADKPSGVTEKPHRKKKHKNKNKKKKRLKAKRAAALASVAVLSESVTENTASQDDQTDTDVPEVEETPVSALEMFLDDDANDDAEVASKTSEVSDQATDEETHDDAITALLAEEASETPEETPDAFEVGEDVLALNSDEDSVDEDVLDVTEVAADHDEEYEGAGEAPAVELVEEDATVDADLENTEAEFEEETLAELDAASDESLGADTAAEETSEEIVSLDINEDDDPDADLAESSPVPAANRFAPVEQTVAEIEGLTSIEPGSDPTESADPEISDESVIDDLVTSEAEDLEAEDVTVAESADEGDADVQDVDSNVTAFAPLEASEADQAPAENMFTEEVSDEEESGADFDNDVAALFSVDEGEDTDVAANDDTPMAEDSLHTSEETVTSKPGLLSATSIAAKLQRIRAVVTSSVGGGDSNLTQGETADEDSLEEDSLEKDPEVAADSNWAETAQQPVDPADWSDVAESDDEVTAEETEFDDEVAAEDAESEVIAAEGQRGPGPIEVSEDDLAAAAEISSSVGSHRPEVFKQTLESLNRDEPSSLSEEDEADLISQLAEASEFAEENSKDGRAILEGDAIEKEEEALERLLEQTNSRLNEDTTQRRQSALSHLKAAVAATIADRNEAQTPVEVDPNKDADSDYRNDLADIVRPKRVTKEERATNSTVAPLVLVPQAKVEDDDQEEAPEPVSYDIPDGGVRPRRISRDEMAATNADVDTGFSDYAEQVGANDLKDLLEAAAAYLNKVEGKPHFSRPQVMHIVMRHDPERSFSREDSLRSFGELLRNGAIEKVDRGQFVISNESKFLAAS